MSFVLQLGRKVFQSQEKPRLLLPANMQVKQNFRCEACTKIFPISHCFLLSGTPEATKGVDLSAISSLSVD